MVKRYKINEIFIIQKMYKNIIKNERGNYIVEQLFRFKIFIYIVKR